MAAEMHDDELQGIWDEAAGSPMIADELRAIAEWLEDWQAYHASVATVEKHAATLRRIAALLAEAKAALEPVVQRYTLAAIDPAMAEGIGAADNMVYYIAVPTDDLHRAVAVMAKVKKVQA